MDYYQLFPTVKAYIGEQNSYVSGKKRISKVVL